MSNITTRLQLIKSTLPPDVTLVAVSKFHPAEAIMEAYQAGQRVFGESRAQEIKSKHEALPKDIEWHFIGHLQTNKVRALMPYVSLFHSVDSENLLSVIDVEAKRIGTTAQVLLQVHVAREETKFGFSPEEIIQLIESGALSRYNNVVVRGIMGMASNTDDLGIVAREFATLHDIYTRAASLVPDAGHFNTLSMGMSHDYTIAIANGSNMVRIGTDIFGEREY